MEKRSDSHQSRYCTDVIKTFDQALFTLFEQKLITYEDALRNADSVNDLRLRIKLEGAEAKKKDMSDDLGGLSMANDPDDNKLIQISLSSTR